jgi:beta-lactamase superfamily II metal-dependent hydrolase
MDHVFAALPGNADGAGSYEKISLRDDNGKKVREVLWGDWLTLAPDMPQTGEWRWIRWAWKDEAKRRLLKIRASEVTDRRPLEMIFLDVGIGDGSVLITPERATDPSLPAGQQERVIVVDAGKGQAMRDFLDARFGTYRAGMAFHAAVISHADLDHYGGFRSIFSNKDITFEHLYHNGALELPTGDELEGMGGVTGPDAGGVRYLKQIVESDAAARAIYDPAAGPSSRTFAKLIATAIAKGNVGSFSMLSTEHGSFVQGARWMPGFAPGERDGYTIEVLGPWVERDAAGKLRLRVFGDAAKTKNGHSVILRLRFGEFSILFGGDLNTPSERFLLTRYAGLDAWPQEEAGRDAMIVAARARFRSDVMKACHHGASDVTDEFLSAVNPAAFVISSGDDDVNYVHPRPDLLGRLGKAGRGAAPVLLSTELQRSTRETEDAALVKRLKRNIDLLAAGGPDTDENDAPLPDAARKAAREALAKVMNADVDTLGLSNVSVDGAIYVKTDGKRLIAAFKKETQDPNNKWFWYSYALKADQTMDLVPRPEH